ncbi:MAG: hypothetical protein N2644_09660 [Candidatus Sumerlaea chitinivorans]|nr:hypothetical protein [Candidatus Sumerlaea chitinivorans]
MERVCDGCGRRLTKVDQPYTLRIEMFASADPVELTVDDLLADHTAQIEKLIEQMEHLDVEEATDQVYETYTFELCSTCRDELHRGLKARAKSKLE